MRALPARLRPNRTLAAVVCAVAALAARAQSAAVSPANGGGSGVQDVPLATVMEPGTAAVSAQFRYGGGRGGASSASPSYFSGAVGLFGPVEVGFSFREGGMPGDPRPAPLLFAGSLRAKVYDGGEVLPSVAVEAALARINWSAATTVRVIGSAELLHGRLLLTGSAGVETPRVDLRRAALSVAAAARFSVVPHHYASAEALWTAGGPLVGIGYQWRPVPVLGVTASATFEPVSGLVGASVGVILYSGGAPAVRPPPQHAPPASIAPLDAAAPPPFTDERPRFRLRIPRTRMPTDPAAGAVTGPTVAGDVGFRLPLGVFTRGASGEDVSAIQRALVRLGTLRATDADAEAGAFGAATQDAVRRFQATAHLAATGDYGDETRAALAAALQKAGAP